MPNLKLANVKSEDVIYSVAVPDIGKSEGESLINDYSEAGMGLYTRMVQRGKYLW